MNRCVLGTIFCILTCCAPFVRSEGIGLDDAPWSDVKGLALGVSRDVYATTFGKQFSPMLMGKIELWPAVMDGGYMCAGNIRDGKVVGVMWTWKRLPADKGHTLTSSIYRYMAAQDANPSSTKTLKVSGERIASVLLMSFRLPQNGQSVQAIITSSEIETTVMIHDGSAPEINKLVNGSSAAMFLKPGEAPVAVRDYLDEHVKKLTDGGKPQPSQNAPPSSAGESAPSVSPSTPESQNKTKQAAPNDTPKSSSSWFLGIGLIAAALGILWWLLRKKK